jgi:hypothetical protein
VVFVKKEAKRSEDLTVAVQSGLRPRKGDVGLEIEVEAKTAGAFAKMKIPQVATYWTYHNDGSLRGNDNAEFTLINPLTFEEADKAVDLLFDEFKKNKATLAESGRTSVHVHLNVGSFYQNRLASLLALWYINEEILSFFCGEHRAGNLFAQRAKDAERVISEAKAWFETKGEYGIPGEDGLHYSALNIGALYKFGSVEIRTMRGLTEPESVKQWVRILRKIYDASANFPDPRTIIEQFSVFGPTEFFHNLFGDEANIILKALSAEVNVAQSLFEGMRFAQDIAYVRDWSTFNPVKTVTDPFGRRTKMKGVRRVVEEMPEEPEREEHQPFQRARTIQPRPNANFPRFAGLNPGETVTLNTADFEGLVRRRNGTN